MSAAPIRRLALDDGWRLEALEGEAVPAALRDRAFDARVPGSLREDLVRAGAVPPLDSGDAERAHAFIGRIAARYGRSLDDVAECAGRAERVELRFDALDVVAEVALDGRALGATASLFHPHRFDVTEAIRAGAARLTVRLEGHRTAADALAAAAPPRPANGDWGPYSFLRTAACSFGWDWGPSAPSAGIAGRVALEAWSIARIVDVRPLVVEATERRARIDLRVRIVRAGDPRRGVRISARLRGPGGRVVAEAATRVADRATEVRLELVVDDPTLWWPRDLGDAALHALETTLEAEGVACDGDVARIGLRRVALIDEGAGPGPRFAIAVNGVPIFLRGANWIPVTIDPGAATDLLVRARVDDAIEANCNALRVWGGGIYERRAFYDACDEAGLLVWQDFMFACATYPEDAATRASVQREARHQVARLARHPSVVLWCGGNENVLAWESWGWKERFGGLEERGERYWLEDLPRIVAEEDPTRPYRPDSPWTGPRAAPPNDPERGDRHTWDLRFEAVREHVPAFCSEFGQQAPPAPATILEAVGSADPARIAAELARRQRGWGGDAHQFDDAVRERFGPAADGDEARHRARLLQARSILLTVTWLRVHQPRCMGALLWQLNDLWTGPSWSVVDVAGRRKPGWFALREACAPRLLAIHPIEGRTTLCAVNDANAAWSGSVRVARRAATGAILAEASIPLDVPPRRAARLGDLDARLGAPDDPAAELVTAELDDLRTTWFHVHDVAFRAPAPRLGLRRIGAGRYAIVAESLLRDLVIEADRLDPAARPDAGLLTLLPGETREFALGGVDLDPRRLADPAVLRCANGRVIPSVLPSRSPP